MASIPSEEIAKKLNVEWIRKLGKGGYGEVFLALDLLTGQHVAIKSVKLSNESGRRKADIRKEIDLQQAVGLHPNVVRIIKRASWDDTFWICMEAGAKLCQGGDLYDLIEDHRLQKQHIHEHTIWSLFSQLVLGIQACHQPETRPGPKADKRIIIHRDLKPDNIFLNKDRTLAKIGDFGMARELKEEEWATSFCGTLTHMAPEILVEGQMPYYDERVDLWALGCILYKLCSLDYAFDDADDNVLKHKIRTERPAPVPSFYSRSLANLVDALLDADASKRPELDHLVAHPGVQLGMAVDRARESASHVTRLEEEKASQAQRLEEAESAVETIQVQLEEQSQYYQAMFSRGKSQIEALKQQLRAEQLSTQAHTAALNEREDSLRLREEACDRLHLNLEHQQKVVDYTANLQASEQASLGQRELDLQYRQDQLERGHIEIAAKEKDLISREQKLARQAALIEAASAKAKSAPVTTTTTRPVARTAGAVKAPQLKAGCIGSTSETAPKPIDSVVPSKKTANSNKNATFSNTQPTSRPRFVHQSITVTSRVRSNVHQVPVNCTVLPDKSRVAVRHHRALVDNLNSRAKPDATIGVVRQRPVAETSENRGLQASKPTTTQSHRRHRLAAHQTPAYPLKGNEPASQAVPPPRFRAAIRLPGKADAAKPVPGAPRPKWSSDEVNTKAFTSEAILKSIPAPGGKAVLKPGIAVVSKVAVPTRVAAVQPSSLGKQIQPSRIPTSRRLHLSIPRAVVACA